MRKRLISILTTITMLSALIPMVIPSSTASAQGVATNMKLGDYVQMGSYYNEPILWRVVGFQKVDKNGNVTPNDFSTTHKSGYLPLLMTDKIITMKSFSPKPTNRVNSYARSNGTERDNWGSQYWTDSTLRQWLNSDATTISWKDGNKPDAAHVRDNVNPYDTEEGFLNSKHFSSLERKAMKTVTQKNLLSRWDAVDGIKVGGTAEHTYNYNINETVQNYDTAYYENVRDTMFVLDIRQNDAVYRNSNVLGNNYYIGNLTAAAVNNSNLTRDILNSWNWTGKDTYAAGVKWHSWLRSPHSGYSSNVRYIHINGNASYDRITVSGSFGVRPAFFLDQSSVVFTGGTGASTSPYTLGTKAVVTVEQPEYIWNYSDKDKTGNDAPQVKATSGASGAELVFSSSDSSVATVDANGKVSIKGAGSVNIRITTKAIANPAVAAADTVTVPVTIKPVKPYKAVVTATSGEDGKVTLTWGNGKGGNVDNGGSAISNFYVERKLSTEGEAAWAQIAQVAGNRNSIIDSDVTNGTSYDYRVSSVNSVGYSDASETVTAKPYKIPDAPQNVEANATSNGSVALSWDAPLSDGGDTVTSYQIKVYSDNDGAKGNDITSSVTVNPVVNPADGGKYTASVIGMNKGTKYHFGIAAVNKAGAGAEASAEATTWTNPAVPQEVTAQAIAKGTVNVEWKTPVFDGGTAITSYKVSYRKKGTEEWTDLAPVAPTSAKKESAKITGLTTGETYEVKVAAVNKSGGNGEEMVGPACDVIEIVAADIPDAPVITGFKAGNRIITITEIKKTDNHASPITTYMVYYRRKGASDWKTKRVQVNPYDMETAYDVVIDGLTNNVEYEIQVSAVNMIGESARTEIVTQKIGLPGPVKNLEIVPKAGQMIEISFDAADSNGSEITQYNIYADGKLADTITDGTYKMFDATSRDNGDAIDLEIAAVSSVGEGEKTGKLVTVGAPTSPVLTKYETDTEGVTVGWNSAATNGNAIRSYTVYIIDEEGNKTPFTRTVSRDEREIPSFELYIGTGEKAGANQFEFKAGGKYTVEVTCTNSAGEGLPSNKGSFTFASPAAPGNVDVEAGNRKLTVSWTRPENNGGFEIVGYNIYLNNDKEATAAVSWEKTEENTYQLYVNDLRDASVGPQPYGTPQGDLFSFTVVIEGLANGNAYTAQVTAVNEKGEGPSESNGEPDIPVTQASAPQNVTATAESGSVIKLSWSRPLNNGGSAITGYVVRAYKVSEKNYETGEYEAVTRKLVKTYGDGEDKITGTIYKATGLETGDGYEFEVTAVTEAGEGLVSDAANGATHTKPGKAVITDAYSGVGNTRIYVEWAAPKDTGNAKMTGYDIYIGDFKMNPSRITEPDADGVYRYTIVSNRITAGQTFDVNVVSYNAVTDAAGYVPPSTDEFVGVSSETRSVKAGSVPPPKKVTLEGNNAGDLTVTWDTSCYSREDLSQISAFVVYLDGSATRVDGNATNTTTFTMRKLGVEHIVQVSAIAGEEGSKSEPVSIVLGTPSKVSNVSAVADAKNSVKVTWTAPEIDSSLGSKFMPTKYTVYVDGVNKGEIGDGVSRVPDGTAMEKTIEGLEGGKEYDVTVTVTNGYGEGAPTEAVKVIPWAEPEAPVISDIKPGLGSFSFKYADGNGNGAQITSHKIYIVNGDGSEQEMTDVVYSDNVATVRGVADGAEHSFYMVAVNSRGLASVKGEIYKVITGVPAAPANLTAQAGVGKVLISFDKAEDVSADIPVSRYDVMIYKANDVENTEIITITPDGSAKYSETIDSFKEENLKNGVEYAFRVRAVNDQNGEGSWSNAVTAIPGTPEAPVITSAVPASGKISVEWTVPQSNASKITSYAIYLNGEETPVLTTITTSAVIDGLENGKEYAVTVSAINLAGEGAQSRAETVIPGGVPGAIDGNSVGVEYTYSEADGCGFILSWDYPQDDGGLPIREYKVTGSGSIVVDNENRTATITGLEKGKDYSYDIVARSDAGDGAKYTTNSFTTLDAPGAPALEGVDSYNNSFILTWTAPANNGGTDITEYIITAKPKNGGASKTFTVANPTPNANGEFVETISEGLTNQKYILSVAAVNAVGRSLTDSNTITVTLVSTVVQTVPSAPNNLEAVAGDSEVTLTWNAPDTDGYSSITKYVIWSGKDAQYMSVAARLDVATLSSVNGKYTYTVTGLKNGEERFYKINAVNAVSADGGAFTQPISATPVKVTVPGAPTWPEFDNTNGVSAYETNAEGNEITITWEAPENKGDTGISGYEVYVDENMNGEVLKATVTDTSYVLTNPDEKTTYNVRVKAVNDAGDGTFSKYIRVFRNLNIRKENGYTYDDYYRDGIYAEIDADYNGFVDVTPVYGKPGIPENAALTKTYDDSNNAVAATVSWEKPTDDGNKPILGYYITINANEPIKYELNEARAAALSDDAEVINDNDSSFEYTFPVDYGETYVVSVSAYNAVGTGASATITPALKMELEAPFELDGSVRDKKFVDLTWSIPNKNIEKYIIYVNGLAGTPIDPATDSNMTVDYDTMTVTYSMEMPEVNKEYNFAVAAQYADNKVSESTKQPITLNTYEEAALAPTNLQVTESGEDIILSWDPPTNLDDDIDHYQIYVGGVAYPENKVSSNSINAVVTIPDIKADMIYTLTVRAISKYGTEGAIQKDGTNPPAQYSKQSTGEFGPETPAMPTNVQFNFDIADDGMLATGKNVTITWDTAGTDAEHTVVADSFKVHIYHGSVEQIDTVTDGSNSYRYEATPGENYVVCIEPFYGVTAGERSNDNMTFTNPDPVPPTAPELTVEQSKDKNTVVLTYTPVEEGIEYYLIVNGDEDNAQLFTSGQSYDLSADIANYFFTIKAEKTYSNGVKTSAKSNIVSVNTNPDPVDVSEYNSNAPEVTGSISNGTDKVKVFWNAPTPRKDEEGNVIEKGEIKCYYVYVDGEYAASVNADAELVYEVDFAGSAITATKDVEIKVVKSIPNNESAIVATSDKWVATPNCNIVGDDDYTNNNKDTDNITNPDPSGTGKPGEAVDAVTIPIKKINEVKDITIQFIDKATELPVKTISNKADADTTAGKLELADGTGTLSLPMDRFAENTVYNVIISKDGCTKYIVESIPYADLSNLGKALEDVELSVGDLNGDGRINMTDQLKLKGNLGKLESATIFDGDLNDDGKVTTTDQLKMAMNIRKADINVLWSK